MDDGLLAAKSKEVLKLVIDYFRKLCNVTLGDGRKFVGVEIERKRHDKSVFIHQYTKKIIEKYGMSTAKTR